MMRHCRGTINDLGQDTPFHPQNERGHMQDLNDLLYFAKVVEHGGFSEASRRLGVPKSRLSRRIAEMETLAGVRLLQRSSRRVTLTSVGERFYERCRAVVALSEAATDVVEQAATEPQGTVRISCPMTLAQTWLNPLLPAFLRVHPKVSLRVVVSNRPVDPVEDQIDIVLRVRQPPFADSSLVVRKLGITDDVLVANAEFIQTQGAPGLPQALSGYATLTVGAAQSDTIWTLTDGHSTVDVQHAPRMASDDMFALKQAVVQGLGIALLPRVICSIELESGALCEVLPGWRAPPREIQAAFPSRRGMVPAVRALLDYLHLHRNEAQP
jgi:DNA-binding transcriptional LysR family regulator